MKLKELHEAALPGPWRDGEADEMECFTSVHSPTHGSFMYVVSSMQDEELPPSGCAEARELVIYLRNHAEDIIRLIDVMAKDVPVMPPADALCHRDLIPQDECFHCQRIAKMHAALAPFLKEE